MRIWHSYGSEHSMNLVLIGRFQSLSAAEAATERMKVLQELADAQWSDDDWRRQDDRMDEAVIARLRELELYDFSRTDLDMFAFDHSVEHHDTTLRIRTDESEVQGFLKVFIDLGARVEVFSAHAWNDDGTPRSGEVEAGGAEGGADSSAVGTTDA